MNPVRVLPSLFNLHSLKAWVVSLALCVPFYAATAASAQEQGQANPFDAIQWVTGPATVSVGSVADLNLPPGYRFADAAGAAILMELLQNPADPTLLGAIIPPAEQITSDADFWFVLFNFNAIGYVKDDEKDNLTEEAAAAVLEAITKGTEEGNRQRRARGWPELKIAGWQQRPFYDGATNHLTWSIRAVDSGQTVVNYDSRVLGRNGVLSVKMVISPEHLEKTVPLFRNLEQGISFKSGERYSEFRRGDKIAEYGLIGLVTGGAAVAVVKSWKWLVKLGAVLVAVLVGAAAKLKSFFKPSAARVDSQRTA